MSRPSDSASDDATDRHRRQIGRWSSVHEAYFHCLSCRADGWVPFHCVALPIDDLGFRQGVTAVERLRTRGGRPFLMKDHLRRLAATTDHLKIESSPSAERLGELIESCLERNRPLWRADGDVGVTVWLTPGSTNALQRRATWCVHLNPIDFELVDERLAGGQPVVVTEVRQPPPESWSRQAKVRCRLHYYLADQTAQQVRPGATGLLLDQDGSVTESSIANVAVVKEGRIVSPPADRILAGVTLGRARAVARGIGIPWAEQPIFPQQLVEADEVLLMGTDTGIWSACSVDVIGNHAMSRPAAGRSDQDQPTIGRRLQARLSG